MFVIWVTTNLSQRIAEPLVQLPAPATFILSQHGGANPPEIVLATGRLAAIFRVPYFYEIFMARICELTGKRPMKGSIIWRSGKPKKQGGIGTHITAITKRKFMPNLQRVKALLPSGEVRYIRVSASAIKKGLVTKAPKRNWTKPEAVKA
jgi:large subunit ribosomal protein L28